MPGVTSEQGCGVGVVESESELVLGGVGVGKIVPTPTPALKKNFTNFIIKLLYEI